MNYDFVEIGTSYFRTELEEATEGMTGISIEAMAKYLDKLPDKPGIKKLNIAIIPAEKYTGNPLLVYYVDKDELYQWCIDEGWGEGLGNAYRKLIEGCNRVGTPHEFHTHWTPDVHHYHWQNDEERARRYTVNLFDYGLVRTEQVETYTWGAFVKAFDVDQIGFLKIDIEGDDSKVIMDMVNFYQQTDITKLPKKVQFESNSHTPAMIAKRAKNKLENVGYTITRRSLDTVAVLNEG